MKHPLVFITALAVLSAPAAVVSAKTDFEKAQQKVRKYAVQDVSSPKRKGLCLCQEGSEIQAGFLLQSKGGSAGDQRIAVTCVVETFNPEGERTSITICDTFTPLTK